MFFPNLNYLIFLIGFITICLCDDEDPRIVSITSEQVKDIGSTVQLNCTTSNATLTPIVWNKKQRDDNIVLAINNLLAIRDNRFEILHDETTQTSSLKIKDIQPSDTGVFECQIVVNANKKSALQVALFVRQPPVINENATTLLVTVPEGQTVKLNCVADGYPRPDITWKREYNDILPGGGNSLNGNILKIFAVRKEDRGVYLCNAENIVGTDSKIINLEVEFPPIISTPRPKTAQAQFYDIDLHCHVTAYPSPSISWFKNGKQLTHNEGYRISHVAQGKDVTQSTIRVKLIRSTEYGDYYCKAINKMGHAEARVHLYESVIEVIF